MSASSAPAGGEEEQLVRKQNNVAEVPGQKKRTDTT